jgi:hypothetical protein
MPYALGTVKSHVKKAADALGPKHGYSVIYGYRPFGSVPNSDHPKGLALDFMSTNKAKGDALVADLIANASAYSVKYIIWWRRIWQDGAWKAYSGPSPHTDHVHVSFNAEPGSGDYINVGIPDVPNPVEGLQDLVAALNQINKGFEWITKKESWTRIGVFGAGIVAVIVGFLALTGKSSSVKEGAQIVSKVARNAKS